MFSAKTFPEEFSDSRLLFLKPQKSLLVNNLMLYVRDRCYEKVRRDDGFHMKPTDVRT